MASLHGIALFTDASPDQAGAWFGLSRAAPASGVITMGNWEVEIQKGKSRLVARGGRATSYESALEEALLHAQQGLDLLAITNRGSLCITDVDEGHGVWWHDGGTVRMRHVSIARLGMPVLSMTATTTTPTSALVPPPALLWDESFRYYRLSQATDDLLDGFRNLYLAFESLLSLIRPRRQSPRRGGGMTFEGEGVWLKEALRAADTIEPLAGHVPVGTASPVDFLHDDLYIAHRNTLFHSKRSASSSAPVPGARTSVEESLRRLVRLYLKLVSAKLGVTFPTSSWNLPALQPYAATLLSGVTVALSDDPSPASSDSPNPAGGALVRLPTSPPVLVGHVQIVRGIASTQLAAIPAIRRFVLLNAAGTVLSSEVFDEGPLLHNGISNLEVHVGLRLDNTREARTRYSR